MNERNERRPGGTAIFTPRRLLLLLLPLVGSLACDVDDDIGVVEFITRTAPDGEALEPLASCALIDREDVEGTRREITGPRWGSETLTEDGYITYRYYVAPPKGDVARVSPGNGELTAEIEADMEFLESGEVKQVVFDSRDGFTYEAYIWGEPDCEGVLSGDPATPSDLGG